MENQIYSIYHFFAHPLKNKEYFQSSKLDEFPYDSRMLSFQRKGEFPDLAIKVNVDKHEFTGGELIELKNCDSYTVASFNSTIPKGRKDLSKVIRENTDFLNKIAEDREIFFSLSSRDIFYLVKGRKKKTTSRPLKICLVHGSFFETLQAEELVKLAFHQLLQEQLAKSNLDIPDSIKSSLLDVDQVLFSQTRHINKASVSIRFRIMTQVNSEGNILNPKQYPQISDDTLNIIVPANETSAEQNARDKMLFVLGQDLYSQLEIFTIQHPLNGKYLVFQTDL